MNKAKLQLLPLSNAAKEHSSQSSSSDPIHHEATHRHQQQIAQTGAGRFREAAINALVICAWVILTTTLVFGNKWILSHAGFNHPIALTLWHMIFCSALSSVCVWTGMVQRLDIPNEIYYRRLLPIAACYAGSLWFSNAAYALCSISFAQMVKAGTPVLVFIVGIVFGTEKFTWGMAADLLVITSGVAISTYGEVDLVVLGLIMLLVSLLLEATRLTLTQQMIQSSGVRFNPLTTLYYLAPLASVCLSVPFIVMESRGVAAYLSDPRHPKWPFIINAANAFGLNIIVFLLIGRTSALTMNICGLVKDWFTISASVMVFHSVVTTTNLVGYTISFCGVCWYNYLRMFARPAAATGSPTASGTAGMRPAAEESIELLKPATTTAPAAADADGRQQRWQEHPPFVDVATADPEAAGGGLVEIMASNRTSSGSGEGALWSRSRRNSSSGTGHGSGEGPTRIRRGKDGSSSTDVEQPSLAAHPSGLPLGRHTHHRPSHADHAAGLEFPHGGRRASDTE